MQDKMDHTDRELSKIQQNSQKSSKLYGWNNNFERNRYKYHKLKYFYHYFSLYINKENKK